MMFEKLLWLGFGELLILEIDILRKIGNWKEFFLHSLCLFLLIF